MSWSWTMAGGIKWLHIRYTGHGLGVVLIDNNDSTARCQYRSIRSNLARSRVHAQKVDSLGGRWVGIILMPTKGLSTSASQATLVAGREYSIRQVVVVDD